MTTDHDLLRVDDLTVRTGHSVILDRVSLEVRRGQRVGLIGESGSGKTTIVRTLIGLLSHNMIAEANAIELDGELIFGRGVDRRPEVRGSRIGTVFQSALTSMHPLRRMGSQFDEILRFHARAMSKTDRREHALSLLRQMAIAEPERMLSAYPHQVSGGQRQRVSIAMALATDPSLLIADESTSALDVRTQAQVVALLRRVVDADRGLIFVTHDLALASEICTHLVVLRRGKVVESGETAAVVGAPQADYTRSLLRSVPPWQPSGSWEALTGAPAGTAAARPNPSHQTNGVTT